MNGTSVAVCGHRGVIRIGNRPRKTDAASTHRRDRDRAGIRIVFIPIIHASSRRTGTPGRCGCFTANDVDTDGLFHGRAKICIDSHRTIGSTVGGAVVELNFSVLRPTRSVDVVRVDQRSTTSVASRTCRWCRYKPSSQNCQEGRQKNPDSFHCRSFPFRSVTS